METETTGQEPTQCEETKYTCTEWQQGITPKQLELAEKQKKQQLREQALHLSCSINQGQGVEIVIQESETIYNWLIKDL